MAKKSRPTFQKRQKELARLEKQKEKLARRLETKNREVRPGAEMGEDDPDLVGIRPGPQPLSPEWTDIVVVKERSGKTPEE